MTTLDQIMICHPPSPSLPCRRLHTLLLLNVIVIGLSSGLILLRLSDGCDNPNSTSMMLPSSAVGVESSSDHQRDAVAGEWGCDNLPDDLHDVLEPHCIVHGKKAMSSLSTLLPNLDFFRRVVHIFDSHARAEVWQLRQRQQQLLQESKIDENETKKNDTKATTMSTMAPIFYLVNQQLKEKAGTLVEYVLVAGRGTTGTRAVSKWLGTGTGNSSFSKKQQNNIGALHFENAQCPTGKTNTARCYRPIQWEGIKRIRSALDQIRNKTSSYVKEEDYEHLFDALEYYLGQPLQECGECMAGNLSSSGSPGSMPTCRNGFGGRVALLDSPMVSLFTELYFALGPDTKVILLRRGKDEWMKSRIGNHGATKVGIVCGNENATSYDARELHDPFSYTQCVATARSVAMRQQRLGSGLIEVDDSNKNTTKYNKNAHIQDIGGAESAYLAESFDKYNLYVEKLVPHDYRLDINLFTSRLLSYDGHGNSNSNNNGTTSANERWSDLNRQLIEEFASC